MGGDQDTTPPRDSQPTLRRPVPQQHAESYLSDGPSLVGLLVVTATAFLVGVRFYVETMPDVPTLVWPLYADSPTALALAMLSLATLLPNLGKPLSKAPANRPLAYLHTLAFVWLVKYGLWTAIALNRRADLYVGLGGEALYDYWFIIGTHLLFVVLAFGILHYGRTTRGALAVSLVALLINDVVDYGFGYHPPLRYEPGLFLPVVTAGLSVGVVVLAAVQFDRLEAD